MSTGILRLSIVVVCVSVFSTVSALAGPQHQAAMAIVHNGEQISDTGNLDAAIAEYDRVETLYPGEYEAIAWARYRLSEIYWAGERWMDAAAAVRWVWDRIQTGTIRREDQRFWCGYQYARCLSKLGVCSVLSPVCRATLSVYDGWSQPDGGQQEAAGWMRYYLSQCEYSAGQFAGAQADANAAWEIGKAVHNGSLASWARLLEVRATMADGNLLLAEGVLNDCLNDYAPHMTEDYAAEVRVRLSNCQAMTGRFSAAHDAVIQLFTNPEVDEGLQAEALVRFAEAAIIESATAQALRTLALAKNAFGDILTWGDIAKARWNSLMKGQNGRVLLEQASTTGTGPERAAIELELARREFNTNAVLARCDCAEGLSSDPRLGREIALLRAENGCSDPLLIYEDLLAQADGNRALVKRLLNKVRRKKWNLSGEDTYGAWLDQQRDSLPRDVYLLEKSKWFRGVVGDCAAALPLLQEAVCITGSPADRIEALHSLAVAYYRTGDDTRARDVVQRMVHEICDPNERERALLLTAEWLRYERLEPAIELYQWVIDSGKNPVWTRDAKVLKAGCYKHFGRVPEAKGLLEDFVQNEQPVSTDDLIMSMALLWLAEICQQLGDTEGLSLVWARLDEFEVEGFRMQARKRQHMPERP
jgi:tetratricopeptide (TPR) repeat protein